MKITSVETIVLRYHYEVPIADAQNFFAARSAVLVLINLDNGIQGIGEAASFGGPAETTKAVIDLELAPHLLGLDPTNIEYIWKMLFDRTRQHGRGGIIFAAISGVDIALWDILGKLASLPVYKLLGGYSDRLIPYASSGFYTRERDPAALAAKVDGYFQKGYRYAKIKIARNSGLLLSPIPNMVNGDQYLYSLDEDLKRVEMCCETAKIYNAKIMVDVNNTWNTYTAIQMGRQLEKLGVYWIEEPLALDNIEGSAELAAALDMPVAGYESETGFFRFKQLIDSRAVDIVQPDVIWSGGITECRRIAVYAFAHSLPVNPHVFSSGVSLAANAHFMASLNNYGIFECDQNEYPLRDELLEEPLAMASDGFFYVPQGPGLGITLRSDTIEKYMVTKSVIE
jgi:L-alanine-DL-glutamate epimerase-like enolase superfamily enzyme